MTLRELIYRIEGELEEGNAQDSEAEVEIHADDGIYAPTGVSISNEPTGPLLVIEARLVAT